MSAPGGEARRRVWVRGAGAWTSLARTWPDSVAALAAGRCAIAPVDAFDTTGFPCSVAARISDLPAGEERRLALALPAAREAWAAAAVQAAPARIGVFVGAESGRASFDELLALVRAAGGGASFDRAAFERSAPPLAKLLAPARVSPASVASALAREFGAAGPVQTVSLACASSSAAIVEATCALRQGECDVALCGGVGADVDAMMLVAFGVLGALSATGVSRPFDVRRDGFVLGEGAAMLVLSSERGDAGVEVAGVGRSLDAHHLTAPAPDGSGAKRAMQAALDDAGGVTIDCVQAHGTSTPLNDATEAAALRAVLGDSLRRAHVSSVKGALGHWIAGAGALGVLCALEAVTSGTVLPTAGLTRPDPDCALPHVIGEALHREVRAALANAFGFGGANSCVVLRRAT